MMKPANILIIRTDRIGDVILSLPLARIIKKKYPECRVTFLVREYTSALTLDHPYIDEVIVLEEEKGKIPLNKNAELIKEKNFDTAIIVYPTFKTALMVFLAGINLRIGSGYRWYSFLFNSKVFEHRKTAEKHELEYNINLLKQIGIQEIPVRDHVNFDLNVSQSCLENVQNTLSDYGISISKPIAIVHPGSGGSAVDISEKKMAAIVKSLSDQDNVKVLVTGANSEFELCEEISSETNAYNLAGKFGLKELIALISLSEIFISNSTGPIHIAAALNKSVIGFYPKILSCSEKRWGPYTTKKVVFSPELDCSNCTREQCERLDCMNTIEIDKVILEVNKHIFRNTEERK